jgi:hypothetical protein
LIEEKETVDKIPMQTPEKIKIPHNSTSKYNIGILLDKINEIIDYLEFQKSSQSSEVQKESTPTTESKKKDF